MNSAQIKILITGVGGGNVGEQIFKALRCGKNDYHITASNTNMEALSVINSEEKVLLPLAKNESYINSLVSVIEANQIEFLIAGSEPELRVISNNLHQINESGVKVLINNKNAIETGLDKFKTNETLRNAGFKTPESLILNQGDFDKNIPNKGYPWVVKPVAGGSGSSGTFIAQNKNEALFFAGYLIKLGYQPLMQQYIGNAESEFTIGVLNMPDQTLAGTFILQRQIETGLSNKIKVPNYSGNDSLGKHLVISSGITQGRVVFNTEIEKTVNAIAAELKSCGPLNVQGRWHQNSFYPFEINPRFSGTSSMRAMAGFNEPEMMIDWYKTGEFKKPEIVQGNFTRGLTEYFTRDEVQNKLS
ncbi:MAG: ATP-grasp domain-containing protein [Bacteroidia bacterium]